MGTIGSLLRSARRKQNTGLIDTIHETARQCKACSGASDDRALLEIPFTTQPNEKYNRGPKEVSKPIYICQRVVEKFSCALLQVSYVD